MPLPPLIPLLHQQIALSLLSTDQKNGQNAISGNAGNHTTHVIAPHFAALYRYLTTEVVDAVDGSSRSLNSDYDSEGVKSELEEWWIELAREVLMIRALGEACAGVGINVGVDDGKGGRTLNDKDYRNSMDLRLRELGVLIAEYLASGITPGKAEEASNFIAGYGQEEIDVLMADELAAFRDRTDEVARVVGQYIIDLEGLMKGITSLLPVEGQDMEEKAKASRSKIPGTSRNFSIVTAAAAASSISARRHQETQTSTSTSTKTASTAADLLEAHLQVHTKNLTITLPTLLNEISTKLHLLLSKQAVLLKTQIKHLETFTHSTQSRYLTIHATFLSTVSKGIALKAQLMSLLSEKEAYAEAGVRDALRDTYADLLREHEDLDKRERQLEILVGEYSQLSLGHNLQSGSELANNSMSTSTSTSTSTSRSRQEDLFRTLGTEYARVEAEIEDVKRDIERLRRG